MDRGFPMPEIAKREENFFNGALPSTLEGKIYYNDLQRLVENLEKYVNELQETASEENILRVIFSRVYNFVIAHNSDYGIFDSDADLRNSVFEACFFLSLCMFLYDTRRVRGLSLRKFIYENSPMEYHVEGSPNYFSFDRKREFRESSSSEPDISSDLILNDEARLRQYRKRLLDKRPVYQHSSEWSAIRRVSEHEWTLYFVLDGADVEIRKTSDRIRLLYNDIYAVLKSPRDEAYLDRLEKAYQKFESKLKKIPYERFLNLGKFFLEHINEDKTCYGINLYRFEKEVRLYGITGEVNRLLDCETENETNDILGKWIVLKDVPFPKLCRCFSGLESIGRIQVYTYTFLQLMNEVVRSSRLVIDKFVEDEVFGKDWEGLFLKSTNDMAENLFYSPDQINYSITNKSQEMFSCCLEVPVYVKIKQEVRNFNNLKP